MGIRKLSRTPQKNVQRDDIHRGGSDIEKIMISKKIKYETLNKLLNHVIPPNKEIVNIFIDVYSMLNNLYTPTVMEQFSSINAHEKFMISSELINLIAHYRHYFYSRKGMYTNFFFYYSHDKSEYHVDLHPDYKHSFYTKRVDDTVEFKTLNRVLRKNLEVAEMITKYIPHAHFFNTGKIDPNIVPYHFIMKQDPDEFSIIYTNDDVQLLNTLAFEDTFVMSAKSDKSTVADNDNLLKKFSKSKKIDEIRLLPSFITIILAMSGIKKYDMDGIKGMGIVRAATFIQKHINDGTLSNINYDIESFIDDIGELISDEDKVILRKNYNLLDLPTIYSHLSIADKLKLDNTIVDLIDAKSLREINDQYYTRYPIHLEELMEGEEYE